MYRNDPYIVLTTDGATKIASSTSAHGGLTMRHVSSDNLFVVSAVEVTDGVRIGVDIPRAFTALRGGDQHRPAQWVRKPTETINIDHFGMLRRPGA
ncbi:MAG TPA: ThiF family adenylyltransferase, partial [Mycobacterium sp.]